jgi:hypothetical protein
MRMRNHKIIILAITCAFSRGSIWWIVSSDEIGWLVATTTALGAIGLAGLMVNVTLYD